MAKYKNLLTGYLNESKNNPERRYLVITNVSDEGVFLEPGEKLYMNETPDFIIEKNPKMPHFTKSVKVEEDQVQEQKKDVSSDIPF